MQLVQISGAALTSVQMRLKARAIVGIERVLQIRRDQLDHLLAPQRARPHHPAPPPPPPHPASLRRHFSPSTIIGSPDPRSARRNAGPMNSA
ncbi:Uncharacterised protein [Mycobacteroides abscessus subsp. abscessus]|nr:Uncharacterised protein [Mycobacteroides abscessus subsp. abscessus]